MLANEALQFEADFRQMASLIADLIRRASASYGDKADWRRDFTDAVKISERSSARYEAMRAAYGTSLKPE